MKTEKLFRKVLVSEHHIGESKLCFRGNDEVYGYIYLNNSTLEWYCEDEGYKRIYGEYPTITHTIEEIELPSEEMLPIDVMLHNNKMYHDDALQKACNNGIKMCYNYILGFINNKK